MTGRLVFLLNGDLFYLECLTNVPLQFRWHDFNNSLLPVLGRIFSGLTRRQILLGVASRANVHGRRVIGHLCIIITLHTGTWSSKWIVYWPSVRHPENALTAWCFTSRQSTTLRSSSDKLRRYCKSLSDAFNRFKIHLHESLSGLILHGVCSSKFVGSITAYAIERRPWCVASYSGSVFSSDPDQTLPPL